MLTKKQVQQWREKGWVIVKKFLDVSECQKNMQTHYPIDAKNPIQDFGSNGETNFPCKYNSLNKITVNFQNSGKKVIDVNHIVLEKVRINEI